MKFISKKLSFIIITLSLMGCDNSDSLSFSGYAHGEFIYLSFFDTEKIDRILVNKGVIVKKGQTLAQMESFTTENSLHIAEKNYQAESALLSNLESGERPEELDVVRSQLARARSAASLAKGQLERYQRLYKSHVVSASEWEKMKEDHAQKNAQVQELTHLLNAKALPARQAQIANQLSRVESAKLQRDKAYWDHQQSTLTAPQDARVYDILYRPGERVVAGRPIISLLPHDNIKIRFFVPEKKLGALHVGMKVRLTCDSCEQDIAGSVNYISPQAEYTPPVIYSTKRREKLLFMAEATPDKESASLIKIGQPVTVEVVSDE